MARGRSARRISGVDCAGLTLAVLEICSRYRVARRPCGRPALSELGVKVSLHPAQALRAKSTLLMPEIAKSVGTHGSAVPTEPCIRASLLLWLARFSNRAVLYFVAWTPYPLAPSFQPRSSTSVLLKIESILYPEFYCSLGPARIHFSFDQEDFFDWFRTPHYPTLFYAAAAHRPVDHRSRRW